MRGKIYHFWHLLCSFDYKQTKHIVFSLLLLCRKKKEEEEKKQKKETRRGGGDYIYIYIYFQYKYLFCLDDHKRDYIGRKLFRNQ